MTDLMAGAGEAFDKETELKSLAKMIVSDLKTHISNFSSGPKACDGQGQIREGNIQVSEPRKEAISIVCTATERTVAYSQPGSRHGH
ncbi:hypothetical protein N7457_001548 [Penicillium paradoxum]|uniref:uncharacterized protein n=1 Tax=Penicillium paradoxum TaxID=176176 RepID=UPI00254750D9|nr:uncharacterized protein N7457_001548 [Penicillium paradoxum]KAJ5794949.1 hypothetical protein N7457_001548 [Penicillium paradoxum]